MKKAVANIKYVRTTPRKLRPLARSLKNLEPKEALVKLKFFPKRAADFLINAIASALANATNNLKLNPENLKIKSLEIDEGPRFKRWRPVSRGVAHQYKKRSSSIKVVLEERSESGTEN